jgi:hypothetical protein
MNVPIPGWRARKPAESRAKVIDHQERRTTVFKHILIATDGSELAGKAVAAGFALARELGAKVTAVT